MLAPEPPGEHGGAHGGDQDAGTVKNVPAPPEHTQVLSSWPTSPPAARCRRRQGVGNFSDTTRRASRVLHRMLVVPDAPPDVLSVTSSLTATGRALSRGEPVEGLQGGNQLDALLDTVQALEATGIRPVLIGGLAVGVRSSVPRATMDIDLATASKVDRSKVIVALTDAGFSHSGSFPHSENFLHPTGEPVQLAFDPAMDPHVRRAEAISIGDRTVHVVRTDDLIAMKERAGNDPSRRPSKALRDLADAALLREGDQGIDDGW